LSALHFIKRRNSNIPLLFLSIDNGFSSLLQGWSFKFDKDGYVKNYNFNVDLSKFDLITDLAEKEKIKRNIIQFILFGQETEYKRDFILNELSKITRIIE